MKVLILGVNGFIGHHLSLAILRHTPWEIYGMDLGDDRLEGSRNFSRFHFIKGNITVHRDKVEALVKKCDTVLPLVAIAVPKLYVTNPLKVFELDFEANLPIIRQCVQYRKRLVFPSTSEVYGMSPDREFNEETSPLVLGPIAKQRWIYSCIKQLLDRVIWAHGFRDGLDFTIFRPFNWIGPRLDTMDSAKEGCSRVLTQFITEMYLGTPVRLVDGGSQRRTFTYIDDGIEALVRIIANKGRRASGQIFNIGNPRNDCSIRDLAYLLRRMYLAHPKCRRNMPPPKIVTIKAAKYYGSAYQDIMTRTPSIAKAKKILGWAPRVGLREALARTLDSFLAENVVPGSGPAPRRALTSSSARSGDEYVGASRGRRR